jgi:glycerol-3-phosphate O-acyltransferase
VVERLPRDVMKEVSDIVPVLPVALVSAILIEAHTPLDELEIKSRAQILMARLEARGAKLYLPRGDRDYAIAVGLRMLTLRRLVDENESGLFSILDSERPLIAYYANSIAHLK